MSKKKPTNAPRLMLEGLVLTVIGAILAKSIRTGPLHVLAYWANILGVFTLIAGIGAWIFQKLFRRDKSDRHASA